MAPMIDIVFNLVVFFRADAVVRGRRRLLADEPALGSLGPRGDAPNQGWRLELHHVEPWPDCRREARIVFCGEPVSNYGELRARLRQTRR
jgi:hypothetical protein